MVTGLILAAFTDSWFDVITTTIFYQFRQGFQLCSKKRWIMPNQESASTFVSAVRVIFVFRFWLWPVWKQFSRHCVTKCGTEFRMRTCVLLCVVCDCVQREMPVIFLPTHRSHLDYVLISFILFAYNIRTPHVAAGDNLLIPFFGFVVHYYYYHHCDCKIMHKVHINSLQK